jgi:hypothetical protein
MNLGEHHLHASNNEYSLEPESKSDTLSTKIGSSLFNHPTFRRWTQSNFPKHEHDYKGQSTKHVQTYTGYYISYIDSDAKDQLMNIVCILRL